MVIDSGATADDDVAALGMVVENSAQDWGF